MTTRSSAGAAGRRRFLLFLAAPAAVVAACRRVFRSPSPAPSPPAPPSTATPSVSSPPTTDVCDERVVILPTSIAVVRNYRLAHGLLPSITFLADTEKPR